MLNKLPSRQDEVTGSHSAFIEYNFTEYSMLADLFDFCVPLFNFKVSFLIRSISSPGSSSNIQYPISKGTFAEIQAHCKSKWE